jgi:predicted CXXCH cytochrome family protein
MNCTNCHDPHSASVKMASGKDASQLCVTCHEEASMNFPYSKHNQEGVTCIDCHLEHLEDANASSIHRVPDHSFKASVQTCNSCHTDQMHADGEAVTTRAEDASVSAAEPTHEATPALEISSIVPEPTPVSPLGYAGLAVLVGLAAGMVLAPWLERWYRFVMQKDEEVNHDGK